VFVAHGLADPVVAPEQGRAVVSAIEGAGGKVESEFYRGELHEIVDEATRIAFHEQLAAVLRAPPLGGVAVSRRRARPATGLALAIAWLAACRSEVVASGSRADARGPRGSPPRAAFFADPLLSHVTLSPDGQRVAAVFARDGVAMLIARPVRGGEIQRLAKLDDPGVALRSLHWAATSASSSSSTRRALRLARARSGCSRSRSTARASRGNLGEQWPSPQPSRRDDMVIGSVPGDAKHVLIHYWPNRTGASASWVDVDTASLAVVVPEKRGVHAGSRTNRATCVRPRAIATRPRVVYARADDRGDFAELAS
jgi:hypothetical protein